jgi:hypothetical protein
MIDLERLPDVLAKMQPEHLVAYIMNLARRYNQALEENKRLRIIVAKVPDGNEQAPRGA